MDNMKGRTIHLNTYSSLRKRGVNQILKNIYIADFTGKEAKSQCLKKKYFSVGEMGKI